MTLVFYHSRCIVSFQLSHCLSFSEIQRSALNVCGIPSYLPQHIMVHKPIESPATRYYIHVHRRPAKATLRLSAETICEPALNVSTYSDNAPL